jgi:hypothetical protein
MKKRASLLVTPASPPDRYTPLVSISELPITPHPHDPHDHELPDGGAITPPIKPPDSPIHQPLSPANAPLFALEERSPTPVPPTASASADSISPSSPSPSGGNGGGGDVAATYAEGKVDT